MASKPAGCQLNDDQVADVRAWLRLLVDDAGSQAAVRRRIGFSSASMSRVLSGKERPGYKFWEAYQEWDQTDMEEHDEGEDVLNPPVVPEPVQNRLNGTRPVKSTDQCAADILGDVERHLREARELVRDSSTFRPLLRPGIEQLSATLNEALSLLEF